MIIPISIRNSYQQSFVICLHSPIKERAFLRRAKVTPGSYAGELLSGLYAVIFHRSLELKNDYAKYYAVEYATFAEYVRKRFLFSTNIVQNVSKQFSNSCQIIYFHPSYSFLQEDYGQDFLVRLLEPRRTK